MQQLACLLSVVVLVVACAGLSDVRAQSASRENPVEMRATQFGRAVSTGNPEEFKRLVAEGFGANMQQIPMPAHIGTLMSYWDMSRGLEFRELQQGKPIFRNNLFVNPVRGGPAGGGYSTVEDLLKFDRALRSGKPLTPAEQIRVLSNVLRKDLRLQTLSDAETRAELSQSFPPIFVDAMFRFFAAGEFNDASVIPTVSEISGRSPRTFEQWADAHADAFR